MGKVSNVDFVMECLKLVAMDHGGDFWVEDSNEGIEDSTVLLPRKVKGKRGLLNLECSIKYDSKGASFFFFFDKVM